jgi:hypothetical protein
MSLSACENEWKLETNMYLYDDIESGATYIQVDETDEFATRISVSDLILEKPDGLSEKDQMPIRKTDLVLHIANGLYEICDEGERRDETKENAVFAALSNTKRLSNFFIVISILLSPSGPCFLIFLNILFRLKNGTTLVFSSDTIYGIVATALYIATKYSEDRTFSNQSYAEVVCRLPVSAFNAMEQRMLELLDWIVWPLDDTVLYENLYLQLQTNLYGEAEAE